MAAFRALALVFCQASEPIVQLDIGVFCAAADILAHQVQLGCRDKQRVRALVGDFDIILYRVIDLDLLHGHEAANTVVFVDHQVTGSQVREGVQLLPVGGGGFFGGPALGLGFGNELPLGQYGKLAQRVFHAVGQCAVG